MPHKHLSKKKIVIYIAILIVVIAGNFYIYYSNSKQSVTLTDFNAQFAASDNQATRFSSDKGAYKTVLEYNLFSALKKIGDWPVTPQNIGKPDPFAPVFSN